MTASFVLILLITISAFGVIFIKYQNRILNIEISENEKKHYYLSESYRQLLKDKADITDKVLQKNSLGKALNMQLPNKERILIMNIDNRDTIKKKIIVPNALSLFGRAGGITPWCRCLFKFKEQRLNCKG